MTIPYHGLYLPSASVSWKSHLDLVLFRKERSNFHASQPTHILFERFETNSIPSFCEEAGRQAGGPWIDVQLVNHES
jgi:hypothetical protein